jgi:putative membrane protein
LSSRSEASERIISYYSYLFTYPSRLRMMAVLSIISIGVSSISFFFTFGIQGIIKGLVFGVFSLTLPFLLSDEIVSRLFVDTLLLNPRRFTIITYSISIVYGIVLLLSSLASQFINRADFIFRGGLLSIAISVFLRHLIIQVFHPGKPVMNVIATFLQPVLCFFFTAFLILNRGYKILFFGVLACILFFVGAQLILFVLNRWDGSETEIKLTRLFRAFILAWTEEQSGLLEAEITRLGEPKDLAVDALFFDNQEGYGVAAFVVPYIHPGPFRNVGSSNLPSILVKSLSERLGCEVIVAHGISNHEMDLTRSEYTHRVSEAICVDSKEDRWALASPLMWGRSKEAQASCQIFGEVALFTLSMSPLSYDDLPECVAKNIRSEAKFHGLKAVVVDSHNSINMNGELEEYNSENLCIAAAEALKAALTAPKLPFSVGVNRIIPEEWSLDDGMGPDGISVLVVKLDNGFISVYVVVDGNNMVSGVRELIIEAVKTQGVNAVEVMTSDTHLVNAIGATNKGYYPIGERTDPKRLSYYIIKAVNAVSIQGNSQIHYTKTQIPSLMVIGEKGLNILSRVLESGFKLFKKTGLTVTIITFLLAGGILFLL